MGTISKKNILFLVNLTESESAAKIRPGEIRSSDCRHRKQKTNKNT